MNVMVAWGDRCSSIPWCDPGPRMYITIVPALTVAWFSRV